MQTAFSVFQFKKFYKEKHIENNITIDESICSNVDALESMYSQKTTFQNDYLKF